MTCIRCGEVLQGGVRFCHACGVPQRRPCAACGEDLPSGARFCSMCGAAQDAAGAATEGPPSPDADPAQPSTPGGTRVSARRVTSVLFGDLVGFTSLAEGRDHEDVRELLSRYFETSRRIVERYGGVVEKFIGDAVMAVWGVPTANEDDAERAVRAGLELVAAVAGLREEVGALGLDLRVGIVTGEVAVTVGATGQGMVAGDAVNTAARVQSVAPAGQVWVDATTRQLAQQAITFADVGTHAMKGKVEPVPLWAARAVVAGAGGTQRADGIEAPLVGRDRELRLIKEVFHRTGEQGTPSLVVLSGEPGVGKSRLAWEFEKYVDGLSAATKWHEGRCVAYGERLAYYALAEAVRARLRLTLSATETGRADPLLAAEAFIAEETSDRADMGPLLARALPELLPDEAERDWIAPRLGALLGVGSLREFAREDLYAAWATFLRRVGEGAESVVLVIDDAEHADEGLIAFVEHLMASRFGVFVLLLTRPSLLDEHPQLVRNPQTMLLNLAPLGGHDVAALLDGLVSGLPAAVRDELAKRAEGVPLYAVETVRSLVDRDLVVAVDGRLVLADREVDLSRIGAPASLQALVTARLDALGTSERQVADAASVLGQSFHRDHLAGMVGPDIDLGVVLERLQRVQLVERETSRWSGDYGQYRFVQAVVPQVAYGMIARRDRRTAHLRAVELFEAVPDPAGELAPVIAAHLTRAAAAVPDAPDVPDLRRRAIDHLTRAADRADSLASTREGVAYLVAARDLADDPVAAARLDLRRGKMLQRAANHAAAIAVLEPLVAIFDAAGDEVAAGTAAGALGFSRSQVGGVQEVRALVESRWQALKDRPGADEAVVALGGALLQSESGYDRREYAEAILKVALRRNDDRLVAQGLRGMCFYYSGAGMPLITRLLEQEALRRDMDNPFMRMLNLSNAAASWVPDDLARAATFSWEAMGLVEQQRLNNNPEFSVSNHVAILLVRGEWDAAAHATLDRRGFERPVEGTVLDFVDTAIALARGRTPAARGWVPGDLDRAAIWHRAFGLAELALRSPAEGRPEALARAVAALFEYMEEAGQSDDIAVLWPAVFEAAHRAGEVACVEQLLRAEGDHAGDLSVQVGFRAQRAWAVGLDALGRGEFAEAIAKLRDGVRLHDEWGSVPYAARSRAALGIALLAAGEQDEARTTLDAARAAFTALGASAWLAELAAEAAQRQ